MSARIKTTVQKKADYFERLVSCLETYPKVLIVDCDNISSAHLQKTRKLLRGKAEILMGKNTLIRRAIRMNLHRNEKWNAILPLISGNVGMVFTNCENLSEILQAVQSIRVPAAAKANTVAQKDVFVRKGRTNLEPTKTSFLQSLNINTKIAGGQIEILNDIHLLKKGERVGSSEATLLQMLDIKPFEYGLVAATVYDDGSVYSTSLMQLKDEDILLKFATGVSNVASLSLELGIPTLPAFPHAVLRGYENMVTMALETENNSARVQKLKEFVNNPSAFAPISDGNRSDGGAPIPAPAPVPAPAPAPVQDDPIDDLFSDFDLFS